MAWPVSPGFVSALAGPHDVLTRVDVLVARQTVLTLDERSVAGTLGGTVQVDGRAEVRRSLEGLEIVDPTRELVPARLGDLLTPPNELRVWRGLRLREPLIEANGRVGSVLRDEYVPLCTVALDSPTVNLSDGAATISVDGYDRSATVAQRRWVDTFTVAAGTPGDVALRDGLKNRLPWLTDADFNFAPTSFTTPRITWGGDDRNNPWLDFEDLARAMGMELLFDPLGKPTLRPVVSAAESAAARVYRPGETQTITDLSRAFTVGDGENGVVVIGEGPDVIVPFRVVLWDDDPLSPTYYLGEWGARPRFIRSELILTSAQGQAAAAAELAGMLGTPEDLRGALVADSSLDAGDVIEVEHPGMRVNDRYVIDSLSVPVHLGDVEFTTRQQRRAR